MTSDTQAFGRITRCGKVDSELAFRRALAFVEPVLRRTARRLTNDRDLRKDLLQEGYVCLWELGPERYDFLDPGDVAYVRRVVTNRVWTVWRAEVGKAIVN